MTGGEPVGFQITSMVQKEMVKKEGITAFQVSIEKCHSAYSPACGGGWHVLITHLD